MTTQEPLTVVIGDNMQQPKYKPNDVVYLRESAAIGHLEPVVISGLAYYADKWIYTIRAGRASPISQATYGDRNSMVNAQSLQYDERELITICEALQLAESCAAKNLQWIRDQQATHCADTTES